VFNCSLSGTLDVSGLTGLGGYFYVYNNANLTSILWPVFTSEPYYINAHGNALNQTCVDDLFAKMDAWYTANEPTDDLYVYLSGGTNSPPSDGSSNVSILHIQSIFDSSGGGSTFDYYINYT
jgi:hypothetical protein